jgi:adenylate cyclase
VSLLTSALKERKLVQWSLGYLAAAWLLYEGLSVVAENFGWPPVIMRAATVLLLVGLAVTVVLAWYHGERGAQRVTAIELAMLIALVVIAGTSIVLVRPGTPDVSTAPSITADSSSVAVLPFVNLGGPENEHFSDGITDELINALGRIPGLDVASRTSSFRYKGQPADAREVGSALNVAHIVEGSARMSDGRLRVMAQLIDTRSGYRLWTQQYDRTLADVFAIQEDIAYAIADALSVRLATASELVPRPTTNPEAYNFYLQARFFWNRFTEEGIRRSIDYAIRAIAVDPEYAPAHEMIGGAYLLLGLGHGSASMPPRDAFAQAKAALLRAIDLDSMSASAHAWLGMVHLNYDYDPISAEREHRRALEMHAPIGQVTYALYLSVVGRFDESVAAAREGVRREPILPIVRADLATVLLAARRYQESESAARAALELDPQFPPGLGRLGDALVFQGRAAEGLESLHRTADLTGRVFDLGKLGWGYAKSGQTDKAGQVILELERMREHRYVPADLLARIHTELGDHDRALDELERALDERAGWLVFVATYPEWDALREEPRFDALMRSLSLR